jgi:hypothetical protein
LSHWLVVNSLIPSAAEFEVLMAQMMQKRNSNMKSLAFVLLSLVLNGPAFAIIRPPYPVKPMPPYHGRFIVIDDDGRWQAVAKAPK